MSPAAIQMRDERPIIGPLGFCTCSLLSLTKDIVSSDIIIIQYAHKQMYTYTHTPHTQTIM